MQDHVATSLATTPRKPRKNATQKTSVTLRMNDGLRDQLDALVERKGYISRTVAIEDAVRAFIKIEGG